MDEATSPSFGTSFARQGLVASSIAVIWLHVLRGVPSLADPLSPNIRMRMDEVASRKRPNVRGEGEPELF